MTVLAQVPPSPYANLLNYGHSQLIFSGGCREIFSKYESVSEKFVLYMPCAVYMYVLQWVLLGGRCCETVNGRVEDDRVKETERGSASSDWSCNTPAT